MHSRWLALVLLLLAEITLAAPADRLKGKAQPVTEAEYRLYDLVLKEKFLTSQTELVVIERFTVTQLGPDKEDLPSQAFFAENRYFDGRLRADLVTDFIIKNVRPSRLEGRFSFGVRYRFLSNGVLEEPEVSLAVPASLTQAPATVGAIGFSRVGFSQRGDQALVYVSDDRPDGTGAGFLFWLRRHAQGWEFVDSEVLWNAGPDER